MLIFKHDNLNTYCTPRQINLPNNEGVSVQTSFKRVGDNLVVSASGVSYEGKLSSGTGKYAASVGGQFVGLVTAQMEDGSSIYKVTPK